MFGSRLIVAWFSGRRKLAVEHFQLSLSQGLDLGHQAVELYTEAGVARPLLAGSWFNDGFAGAMGELLCAIEDEREALNSARDNLSSLKICQAALRSVRTGVPEPV